MPKRSKWVQLVSGFHEPLEAKMKSLEAKIAEMQVLTGFDLLLDLLAQPVDPSRNRNLVSQMPPKDSVSCCRVVEISDFSRWKK